jgi:FkbM family methyltransferase
MKANDLAMQFISLKKHFSWRTAVLRILSVLWDLVKFNFLKDGLLSIGRSIANRNFIYTFRIKRGPKFGVHFPDDISWLKYALCREYENYSLSFLRQFAKKFPGTYIDVGSNIGWFSTCMLYFNNKNVVHAFEPQKSVFKRLLGNVELNHFSNRLIANNIGLSSDLKSSIQIFNMPDDPHGHAFLEFKPGSVAVDKIELWSLDYYVDFKRLSDLKFIKVDVEGHELDVFKGATKTISRFKPVVMFEVKVNGLITDRLHSIIEIFLSCDRDYKLFKIPEFKGQIVEVLIDDLSYHEDFRNYTNVMFVHKSIRENFNW